MYIYSQISTQSTAKLPCLFVNTFCMSIEWNIHIYLNDFVPETILSHEHTVNQRTNGSVAHLSPLILSTQVSVTLKQIVKYGSISNAF